MGRLSKAQDRDLPLQRCPSSAGQATCQGEGRGCNTLNMGVHHSSFREGLPDCIRPRPCSVEFHANYINLAIVKIHYIYM